MREQLLAEPQTLRRAAEKVTAKGNAARFLLIVDQFEELFTLCNDGEAQRAYLDNLLAAAASMGGVHILIGLRADFTGHLTEPKELKDLVEENIVLLGRMEQEELVRVIMEPAKVGGWAFVDGLVEQILKDVGREPGRLPLLSHALLETWERRSAHVMTLKGYQEAGGVDGAIAKTAEDTLRRLGDGKKRAIIKAIFLELTELGEGAEDTRRIAQRDDLARTGDEADVSEVLEVLVKQRLVTVDGDSVEVAHEALIRRWPQLREWLDDNRERLRFQRRFDRDAREWAKLLKRDPGALYRGARLAQAEEWAAAGAVMLNALSTEFLEASKQAIVREEQETEARRQQQLEQQRQLAEEQRKRAEEAEAATERQRELTLQAEKQQRTAEARELAFRSTAERKRSPKQGLLLAYRAMKKTYSADGKITGGAYAAAHDALTAYGQPLAVLEGHTNYVRSAAFSPDGKRIVTASRDNTARLWDGEGQPLAVLEGHTDDVNSAAFSPDGARIVTASDDGTARLWDGQGQPLAVLEGHTGMVWSAAFSPGGARIVTASWDNTARLWRTFPDETTMLAKAERSLKALLSEQAFAELVGEGEGNRDQVQTEIGQG